MLGSCMTLNVSLPMLVLTLGTGCAGQPQALFAAMYPEAGQCPSWYAVR